MLFQLSYEGKIGDSRRIRLVELRLPSTSHYRDTRLCCILEQTPGSRTPPGSPADEGRCSFSSPRVYIFRARTHLLSFRSAPQILQLPGRHERWLHFLHCSWRYLIA